MATKYECDRCSEQFTRAEDIGRIEYPLIGYGDKIGDETHKDLCGGCIRELHEFLKVLPKQG